MFDYFRYKIKKMKNFKHLLMNFTNGSRELKYNGS